MSVLEGPKHGDPFAASGTGDVTGTGAGAGTGTGNVSAGDAASSMRLRDDLRWVVGCDRGRPYRIVIDEIGGRFVHVGESLWRRLAGGTADLGEWQSAVAAGLTRTRPARPPTRFTPLYFRVPVVSIDSVARRLAGVTGWLFAPAAILFWSLVIAVAAVLMVSHATAVSRTLASLPTFLAATSPLKLGLLFGATKVLHELAHATMCRRMGGRCGKVGVVMLCGVPCPYCDVTDVWRQTDAAKRIAVMAAGVYVECIVAAVAVFVWLAASDLGVQSMAMNVIIVCSISTFVFNANPLMRYDGYYVLGDLLGSMNLRREASAAFRSVVVRRVAGRRYADRIRSDRRSVGMSVYHGIATVYRIAISVVIAGMLVRYADHFGMRPFAVAAVMLAAVAMFRRAVLRFWGVVVGRGSWAQVPTLRRRGIAGGFVLGLLFIGFVPLPRYQSVSGRMDVAGAHAVYLPVGGQVTEVAVALGDRVVADQVIARVHDEAAAARVARLSDDLAVASTRSAVAQQAAIEHPEMASQWETLESAERVIAEQLAAARRRVASTTVRSPVAGVIIPALEPSSTNSPSVAGGMSVPRSGSSIGGGERYGVRTTALHSQRVGDAGSPTTDLGRSVGSFVARQSTPWCRVAPEPTLRAILMVDARDRAAVSLGCRVWLTMDRRPDRTYRSTVTSVSAIRQSRDVPWRRGQYRVVCELSEPFASPELAAAVGEPSVVRNAVDGRLLPIVGSRCDGVIDLPWQSLARRAVAGFEAWVTQ